MIFVLWPTQSLQTKNLVSLLKYWSKEIGLFVNNCQTIDKRSGLEVPENELLIIGYLGLQIAKNIWNVLDSLKLCHQTKSSTLQTPFVASALGWVYDSCEMAFRSCYKIESKQKDVRFFTKKLLDIFIFQK